LHSQSKLASEGENGAGDKQKNLNPFATEEDDESDEELEGERNEAGEGKNVGTQINPSSPSISRASFPSLWPFGNDDTISHYSEQNPHFAIVHSPSSPSLSSPDHLRGANSFSSQSSDEDNSSEEEEEMGYDPDINPLTDFESLDRGREGKRRLSSTTEAKRRTSLEDDDEEGHGEGVVHVALDPDVIGGEGGEVKHVDGETKGEVKDVGAVKEGGEVIAGDEEELVESMHSEGI